MVFNSPSLIETANVKIPNGQIVYVYKMAENNKRFLVGKKPSVDMDSINKGLYGWVSSNVISSWGERSAIKLKIQQELMIQHWEFMKGIRWISF